MYHVCLQYIHIYVTGIVLFASDKLPYNCRIHEYGKSVKVFAYKAKVGVASVPGTDEITAQVADTLNKVIPRLQVHTLPNMLAVTLSPANQCIHPGKQKRHSKRNSSSDQLQDIYTRTDNIRSNLF
jgi:hypothetical protein